MFMCCEIKELLLCRLTTSWFTWMHSASHLCLSYIVAVTILISMLYMTLVFFLSWPQEGFHDFRISWTHCLLDFFILTFITLYVIEGGEHT